jgi:hypothetical protein
MLRSEPGHRAYDVTNAPQLSTCAIRLCDRSHFRLAEHSQHVQRGSFQMRGRANDVTTSEPVLFWGLLGFSLTMGLLGLYAGFRDVRYLRRRHQKKT